MPPDDHSFPGTERFSVIRRLGAGGMGVVYEAFDRERNERVALKTLREFDARALYRFKQEFRSLSEILAEARPGHLNSRRDRPAC